MMPMLHLLPFYHHYKNTIIYILNVLKTIYLYFKPYPNNKTVQIIELTPLEQLHSRIQSHILPIQTNIGVDRLILFNDCSNIDEILNKYCPTDMSNDMFLSIRTAVIQIYKLNKIYTRYATSSLTIHPSFITAEIETALMVFDNTIKQQTIKKTGIEVAELNVEALQDLLDSANPIKTPITKKQLTHFKKLVYIVIKSERRIHSANITMEKKLKKQRELNTTLNSIRNICIAVQDTETLKLFPNIVKPRVKAGKRTKQTDNTIDCFTGETVEPINLMRLHTPSQRKCCNISKCNLQSFIVSALDSANIQLMDNTINKTRVPSDLCSVALSIHCNEATANSVYTNNCVYNINVSLLLLTETFLELNIDIRKQLKKQYAEKVLQLLCIKFGSICNTRCPNCNHDNINVNEMRHTSNIMLNVQDEPFKLCCVNCDVTWCYRCHNVPYHTKKRCHSAEPSIDPIQMPTFLCIGCDAICSKDGGCDASTCPKCHIITCVRCGNYRGSTLYQPQSDYRIVHLLHRCPHDWDQTFLGKLNHYDRDTELTADELTQINNANADRQRVADSLLQLNSSVRLPLQEEYAHYEIVNYDGQQLVDIDDIVPNERERRPAWDHGGWNSDESDDSGGELEYDAMNPDY